MEEETITLEKRDAERLRVLHQVMDRLITQVEAGQILSITDRQVRTLLARAKRRRGQVSCPQEPGKGITTEDARGAGRSDREDHPGVVSGLQSTSCFREARGTAPDRGEPGEGPAGDDVPGVVEEAAGTQGRSRLAGAQAPCGRDGADGRITPCLARRPGTEDGLDGLCG